MALVQAVAERADSELPSPRIKPCVLKALLPLGAVFQVRCGGGVALRDAERGASARARARHARRA